MAGGLCRCGESELSTAEQLLPNKESCTKLCSDEVTPPLGLTDYEEPTCIRVNSQVIYGVLCCLVIELFSKLRTSWQRYLPQPFCCCGSFVGIFLFQLALNSFSLIRKSVRKISDTEIQTIANLEKFLCSSQGKSVPEESSCLDSSRQCTLGKKPQNILHM